MFQSIIIGNLGADCQIQNQNGSEFVSFRVAHTSRFTDQAGQVHESTQWIDCTLNGHPKVAEFLRKGATVCVFGDTSTRVYSSAKDRCMKAGVRVAVRHIELIGARPDSVPSRLYDHNGVQHDVMKYYLTDVQSTPLMSQAGAQFVTDANGWVTPVASEQQQQAGASAASQQQQYDEANTNTNSDDNAPVY